MKALEGVRDVVDLHVARMLHGEQAITLHRPFPPEGTVRIRGRISEVWDKGSAGVIGVESDLVDDNGVLATTFASLFAKGYGGFGGERGPDTSGSNRPPEREPDHVLEDTVNAEQAALYRLSGDRVPLHIDPAFARKAGYPGPFLHGLCTYGFVGRAVLRALCDNDPGRLTAFRGRFADLVWMGDRIVTKIWVTGDGEAVVQAETQRGNVVLAQSGASFRTS
jgi:acyl dehydratase